MHHTGVLIAGAGPVGLTLACEVSLHGVPVTILERRKARSAESRALGIHARTLDLLAMRGLEPEFTRLGNSIDTVALRFTGGHSTALDLAAISSDNDKMLILPQSETERILEERARSLGAQIVRQASVTQIKTTSDDVRVTATTPDGDQTWVGGWMVGCDGAHSRTRELIGASFEGSTYPYSIMVADAQLRRAPEDELSILVGPTGLVVCTSFGDGLFRVAVVEHGHSVGDEPDIPMDEISAGLERVAGIDFGPFDPVWTSRFIIEERLAGQLRQGRILLAGDAAHVHSPLGGQGLNLGVQDAFNLGWKLAAVFDGRAQQALLDTYAMERGRRAQGVITATDKITRLMMAQGRVAQRVRGVVAPAVLGQRRVQRIATEALSGVSTRYGWHGPIGRSVVGRAVPNLLLRGADGQRSRLFDHLRDGRHVLISGDTRQQVGEYVVAFHGTIIEPGWFHRDPLLVRPDGHVAAAGRSGVARALREIR